MLFGIPFSIATTVATAAANVSKALSDSPLEAVSNGPLAVNYGVYDLSAFLNPALPPEGANDPTITVTAAHPLPIILVNGTFATQGENWSVGAPVLANAGYKVYTYNYGNTTDDPNALFQSLADISQSAHELSAEIDMVLAETGAPKVILIGHSQGGGILPAYYINLLGGADKVSQLIGIAPSNHGTDFNDLVELGSLPIYGPLIFDLVAAIGPALVQQTITSSFQDVVYHDGDTRPGVLYTNIITTNDWIVTPYTQQALDGPNVMNIVIQDQDPDFISGHVNIAFSAVTWNVVLDALAANPEANPQQTSPLADMPIAA